MRDVARTTRSLQRGGRERHNERESGGTRGGQDAARYGVGLVGARMKRVHGSVGVLGLLGGLRSFVLFCVGDAVAVEVGVVILINLC